MRWQDNLKNTLYVKEDDLHEKFKSFLRLMGVERRFEYCLKNYAIAKKGLNTDSLSLYLKDVDRDKKEIKGYQYVNWAFAWSETPDGYIHWAELNRFWRDEL